MRREASGSLQERPLREILDCALKPWNDDDGGFIAITRLTVDSSAWPLVASPPRQASCRGHPQMIIGVAFVIIANFHSDTPPPVYTRHPPRTINTPSSSGQFPLVIPRLDRGIQD